MSKMMFKDSLWPKINSSKYNYQGTSSEPADASE